MDDLTPQGRGPQPSPMGYDDSVFQRLLKERPRAVGLAVPAMPVGSPGMDGPAYRGRKDPYDVLLVTRDGTSTVYQSYR